VPDGESEGPKDDVIEGPEDGATVGNIDGFFVGFQDGRTDGLLVGAGVQSMMSSRQKVHTEHPGGQESTPHMILPSSTSLFASGH
jgi:hypothetical protein